MRKTYKFSHSVVQSGYLYAHRTATKEIIKNKGGLRNALNTVAKKFKLIDITIKIYDSIFLFFFMTKPMTEPKELIHSIQKNIAPFGLWDKDYIYTTVYGLQEEYISISENN